MTRRWPFWVASAAIFFALLYLLGGILLPFVLGMGIAYFLDPVTDRLERWRLSRGIATAVIIISFFSGLGLLSILVVPLILEQLGGLLADLPRYIDEFNRTYVPEIMRWLRGLPPQQIESIQSAMNDSSGAVMKLSSEFIGRIFASGMTILTVLSLILITPIVAFYLLRDWDYMIAQMDKLLPRQYADTIREQLTIVDRTLAGFIRGQLNVCLLMGIFYAVGLTLVGLKFGAVIGFMTGLLLIFPYIGFLVSMIVGLGVAFFQFGDIDQILPVLGVFLIGQFIESYFVTPRLIGEKVGLHPVWIIFGMLAGGALFGMVGVLLAIPITAVIGVLIRFMIDRYLQSSYYTG